MPRGNGGIIGPANIPTTNSAKGVWSISEQAIAQSYGIWPYLFNIDVFSLGAGGGGGSGGGGSGGISYKTSLTVSKGALYTIVVGSGGAAYTNGNDSSFSGPDVTSVIGFGGGTGGNGANGTDGGSGGGGGGSSLDAGILRNGGSATQGSGGSSSYGSAGGNSASLKRCMGGGGGTGAVGNNGIYVNGEFNGGGAGGAGTSAFSIWLIAISRGVDAGGIRYIGGGGGGATSNFPTVSGGAGGIGGGGAGAPVSNQHPTAGTINTGGGGGGGWAQPDASGGSGLVTLRYSDTLPAATSTTGSPTTVTSNGFRYYTWNGNGTITF